MLQSRSAQSGTFLRGAETDDLLLLVEGGEFTLRKSLSSQHWRNVLRSEGGARGWDRRADSRK